MQIKQFEDKNLSQYSYAILSECEKKIILIDPARNTKPYLDYADDNGAQITGVTETHPHADFVSSHLELHLATGATIYTSKSTGAFYPHQAFDDSQSIQMGEITLLAINTPGHSPDSITILLQHDDKQRAVFTGDTLFIGDCGRPDLREETDKIKAKASVLAKQMYHSLRDKLMKLDDDVLVYPSHGAGTLCGKNISHENSSTIGKEKQTNWSLQQTTESEFVKQLLDDQPFVPHYFPFNVALNRTGAKPLQESISAIIIINGNRLKAGDDLNALLWIIDTRKQDDFKKGHLPHSINLMEEGKFETWLGSLVQPDEKFYLAADNREQLQRMLERAAAIGYETSVEKAFVVNRGDLRESAIDINHFTKTPDAYTIVDVRNLLEVKKGKIFSNSMSIPLAELRSRIHEIPTGKPIVVHCAGGYRSAAASSLISSELGMETDIFDLGDAVKAF